MNSTPKQQSILLPGEMVYIREFGDGPYILVQSSDDLCIDAHLEKPIGNKYRTSKFVIHNTWLVRDKQGRYHQLPRAILTAKKPAGFFESFSAAMVGTVFILVLGRILLSYMWG